jgi:5-(carboxyamino)imidazole ribonucleotide synthase
MSSAQVGILGGGQLGRMLALAGISLDICCRFLDREPDAPAAAVAEQIVGDFNDTEALARLADGVNAITYEFENVPLTAAQWLAQRVPVFPPPGALESSQERLAEKRFFERLGIPTPRIAPADNRDEFDAAIRQVGSPAVVKTRRFGYDGKGQFVLRSSADAETAWNVLGGKALIVESFVPFDRELSILSVRSAGGAMRFYPLVQNTHRDGILRLSVAPAPAVERELQARAEEYARRIMEALNYVGVLAIELFQVKGELLANEMAPRVHNSGHWTIEGAVTSQFENHLRAVLGLPLGATDAVGHSAMLNLIGELPEIGRILEVPGAHLHLYGKSSRARRKLGHVTLRADSVAVLTERLELLRPLIR